MEIYTKGDRTRVVETAADRVAAEWDGFRPTDDSAAKAEEQTEPVSTPSPTETLSADDTESDTADTGRSSRFNF
jgi:hypothetical protein